MQSGRIYVSELSATRHNFPSYHFCRGNSSQRKTRIGIILKGSGTYIYLNKRLPVNTGDMVFIPENIYCYSEWRGNPEIDVLYVSSFMHYERFCYEPQTVACGETERRLLLRISGLLSAENSEISKELEAYSLFYRLLSVILPRMETSRISTDTTLLTAIAFITDHWDSPFSVTDVARNCCISESTLYHLFQKELGQTPIRFLNAIKINHAIEYLENSKYSISTISRLACFASENHFRKVFADITGTTPLKFRKNNRRMA